mmetsp:Transcript_50959/g.94395  ORF Transcript_50959/g.94395 Transcript_50959/m.94395 type:complete len:100 (+) Transcript_50959:1246-1545(+)
MKDGRTGKDLPTPEAATCRRAFLPPSVIIVVGARKLKKKNFVHAHSGPPSNSENDLSIPIVRWQRTAETRGQRAGARMAGKWKHSLRPRKEAKNDDDWP